MSLRETRQKLKEKAWGKMVPTGVPNIARDELAVWLKDVLALLDLQEKELREKERKKEYAILTPSTEDEILAFIPIKEILGEKEA